MLMMEISFDLLERTRKLCEFRKSVLVKAYLEFSVTKGVKHFQEQARGLQSVLGRRIWDGQRHGHWTQEKQNRARQWVINGVVTQDAVCKYGWVQQCGTETHRLYHCKGWKKVKASDGE